MAKLPKRLNPFKQEHREILRSGLKAIEDARIILDRMRELGVQCDDNDALCIQFKETLDALREDVMGEEFTLEAV